MAEGAIGMALHLVKRFGPLTALVREGRWAERGGVGVGDLDGATLGRGRLRPDRPADRGARRGVRDAGPGLRPVQRAARRACAAPSLGDLAARSDVITLHLPLNDQTRHLVGDAFLARVKPGAVLVNCGRGGLLDTDAVWRALTGGRLSGVGLDVFDPEPPGRHPLFSHPDVVLTPHLMGLSRRATAATFDGRRPGRPRRARRPRAAGRRRSRLAHPLRT